MARSQAPYKMPMVSAQLKSGVWHIPAVFGPSDMLEALNTTTTPWTSYEGIRLVLWAAWRARLPGGQW